MAFTHATRARICLRDSAAFEGRPVRVLIARAFREAGVEDASVHHGIMGFDPASGVLNSRPLRLHADLSVVEAVEDGEKVQRALLSAREVLDRGLNTLADMDLYVSE